MPSPRWPMRSMRSFSVVKRLPEEEFTIAVAALDGRRTNTVDAPAELRHRLRDARANVLVPGCVAHDALLHDAASPSNCGLISAISVAAAPPAPAGAAGTALTK